MAENCSLLFENVHAFSLFATEQISKKPLQGQGQGRGIPPKHNKILKLPGPLYKGLPLQPGDSAALESAEGDRRRPSPQVLSRRLCETCHILLTGSSSQPPTTSWLKVRIVLLAPTCIFTLWISFLLSFNSKAHTRAHTHANMIHRRPPAATQAHRDTEMLLIIECSLTVLAADFQGLSVM